MLVGKFTLEKYQLRGILDNLSDDNAVVALNFLVDYLCEYPQWVDKNISTVDRELLVKLGKMLDS